MIGFIEVHNSVTGSLMYLNIANIVRIQFHGDRTDVFTVSKEVFSVSDSITYIEEQIGKCL